MILAATNYFIRIGPGFVPLIAVTTRMTLDARGTEMTLTGRACVSGLAKLMIGIS